MWSKLHSLETREGNSSQNTTVTISRSKVQFLLHTAQTYAYTSNNELVPVQILMDGDSQCLYISSQLKMTLKFKPLGEEQLTVNTFGNEHFSKKRCDLIRGRLQAKQSEEIVITAVDFPTICSSYQYPVTSTCRAGRISSFTGIRLSRYQYLWTFI